MQKFCEKNATNLSFYENFRRNSDRDMLHSFAVTHPLMVIAIAVITAFYFTGVYLLVSSMASKPEWFEDENGELHYLPHAR